MATDKAHILFLTSCGKVLAEGSNEYMSMRAWSEDRQLGDTEAGVHHVEDIVSVACGAECSVMLDKEGNVGTLWIS